MLNNYYYCKFFVFKRLNRNSISKFTIIGFFIILRLVVIVLFNFIDKPFPFFFQAKKYSIPSSVHNLDLVPKVLTALNHFLIENKLHSVHCASQDIDFLFLLITNHES